MMDPALVSQLSVNAVATNSWASSAFHVNCNLASIFFVSSFIFVSILCIAGTSLPGDDIQSTWKDFNLHPVTASGTEELSVVSYFIAEDPFGPQSSHDEEEGDDIEMQMDVPNSTTSRPTNDCSLQEAFSEVKLTFGTDKPEVYLNILKKKDKKVICRCPCNHESRELSTLPHVSNTMKAPTQSLLSSDSLNEESLASVFLEKSPSDLDSLHTALYMLETSERDSIASLDNEDIPSPSDSRFLKKCVVASQGSLITPTHELILQREFCRKALQIDNIVLMQYVDGALFYPWRLFSAAVCFLAFVKALIDRTVERPFFRWILN